MSKKKSKSIVLSITVLVVVLGLVVFGIYFIITGVTTEPPTSIDIGGNKVETTSVGVVLIAIAAIIILAGLAVGGGVLYLPGG